MNDEATGNRIFPPRRRRRRLLHFPRSDLRPPPRKRAAADRRRAKAFCDHPRTRERARYCGVMLPCPSTPPHMRERAQRSSRTLAIPAITRETVPRSARIWKQHPDRLGSEKRHPYQLAREQRPPDRLGSGNSVPISQNLRSRALIGGRPKSRA